MKINLFIIVLMVIVLSSCSKDGYRVENGRVVYESPWNEGQGTVIRPLDANPLTFEVLGSDNLNWAKDDSNVYWGYIKLDFMDSSSFKVLSVSFAKDKKHVICGQDIIKETNPIDFELRSYIENDNEYIYGVDDKAAYLCDAEPNGYLLLDSSSIEAFKPLGSNFFIDNETVRWGSHIIIRADLDGFQTLGGNYASDGRYIYYTNDVVIGADLESFEVIERDRAKDKNSLYYMADRVVLSNRHQK